MVRLNFVILFDFIMFTLLYCCYSAAGLSGMGRDKATNKKHFFFQHINNAYLFLDLGVKWDNLLIPL